LKVKKAALSDTNFEKLIAHEGEQPSHPDNGEGEEQAIMTVLGEPPCPVYGQNLAHSHGARTC